MVNAAFRTTFPFFLKRLALLAAVWLGLTGASLDGLAVGAVGVPLAAWLSLRLLPPSGPLRPLRLLRMLPGFFWHSLVGGIDVAWRACHPRLPLRPGWRALPVALPDGGKVTLGAEFSLMPGTLVAGSDGDRLLIHVLDRDQDVEAPLRREEARLGAALSEEGP